MVDKIANPAAAANAYANIAKIGGDSPVDKSASPSFGDVLKNSIADSIGVMKAGDAMSAKAVTGEATLPDVVQAVNAADLTLRTVISIRDRLVNAYQEIMRTQM